MAIEIERKYLLADDSFLALAAESHKITQGYLCRSPHCTVRVRTWDDKGFVTIKGKTHNTSRAEYEYEIPLADAKEMLRTLATEAIISKTRHIVWHEGNKWEIDVFGGAIQGFMLAEIELPSEDHQFAIPPFIGKEVTGDPRYYNSVLATLTAPPL